MVISLSARSIFGLAAVLAGAVVLLSHEAALWERVLAIVQIGAGATFAYSQAARWAAAVLGALFLVYSFQVLALIIGAPAVFGNYEELALRFSIVCGAAAAYSAALARPVRLGLGLCTVIFALAQIVYLRYTASLVPLWLPPGQMFWTNLSTAAFALAAIALLVNRQAQLAAYLMALMIALFGLLVWVPLIVVHPHVLSNWSEIAENFLVMCAAWIVGQIQPRRAPAPALP
jgi:hypothetical protein